MVKIKKILAWLGSGRLQSVWCCKRIYRVPRYTKKSCKIQLNGEKLFLATPIFDRGKIGWKISKSKYWSIYAWWYSILGLFDTGNRLQASIFRLRHSESRFWPNLAHFGQNLAIFRVATDFVKQGQVGYRFYGFLTRGVVSRGYFRSRRPPLPI